MPATLLHVNLPQDVYIPISQTNVTWEINATTILVIKKLDAHKPLLIVMTMISVLMMAATHLLDAHIPHMIVMITMLVPPNHVQVAVIMNELTVTITMLVQMTAVKSILVVNTLPMIVTTTTLVLLTTVSKQQDVITLVLTAMTTMLVPLTLVALKTVA